MSHLERKHRSIQNFGPRHDCASLTKHRISNFCSLPNHHRIMEITVFYNNMLSYSTSPSYCWRRDLHKPFLALAELPQARMVSYMLKMECLKTILWNCHIIGRLWAKSKYLRNYQNPATQSKDTLKLSDHSSKIACPLRLDFEVKMTSSKSSKFYSLHASWSDLKPLNPRISLHKPLCMPQNEEEKSNNIFACTDWANSM